MAQTTEAPHSPPTRCSASRNSKQLRARAQAVHALRRTSQECAYSPNTTASALNFLDIFMEERAAVVTNPSKLTVAALVALRLASKFEESEPLPLAAVVALSNGAATEDEARAVQRDMFGVLDGRLRLRPSSPLDICAQLLETALRHADAPTGQPLAGLTAVCDVILGMVATNPQFQRLQPIALAGAAAVVALVDAKRRAAHSPTTTATCSAAARCVLELCRGGSAIPGQVEAAAEAMVRIWMASARGGTPDPGAVGPDGSGGGVTAGSNAPQPESVTHGRSCSRGALDSGAVESVTSH